jgi:hypothetical protein
LAAADFLGAVAVVALGAATLAGFAAAVGLAAFTVSVLSLEAAGFFTFVAVPVLASAMIVTPKKLNSALDLLPPHDGVGSLKAFP